MTERVLVLTSSYPAFAGDPSGHFVASEVRRLAATGAQVLVVAPGSSTDDGSETEVLRVADGGCFGWPGALARVREDPRRAVGAARFVRGAIRAARARGPFDLTVAHFMIPCGFPIAARLPGRRELVGHGSDVRLFARMPGATATVRRWLADGCTLRFSSEDGRTRLARATGIDLKDAIVSPSPIDVPEQRDRSGARRSLGLDDELSLAVVVGRLIPDKRVDRAIAHGLRAGLEVVVIGDGPLRGRLTERFPSVRFTGLLPRDRTLTWLAAADALIHASAAEGAPTVIREARSLGVPVVAARAGDVATWAASDPGIELVDFRATL